MSSLLALLLIGEIPCLEFDGLEPASGFFERRIDREVPEREDQVQLIVYDYGCRVHVWMIDNFDEEPRGQMLFFSRVMTEGGGSFVEVDFSEGGYQPITNRIPSVLTIRENGHSASLRIHDGQEFGHTFGCIRRHRGPYLRRS